MKAIFEIEDAVVGVICGLLILGYAGKYFSLKLNGYVYAAAFAVFIIFIFLDIINELKDLSSHFGFIMLSLVHNLIDLAISLSFISFFTKWNIPYITTYLVPYLQSETLIGWIGIFLVAGNAMWFILFPFAN
ncbi:MAG: hypothetical protein AABX32_03420 [Nanoarchaeota archaeon]